MGLLSTVRNVAAGRLPPATRLAVLCGCGVFVVGLLVFKPVAGSVPQAKPLTAGVVLLPPGDALAETHSLLDPSLAFLPATRPKTPALGSDELQVEEVPLAGFDPILRFTPDKPVDLTLESEKPVAVAPQQAIPLSAWEPFATLGSVNLTRSAIPPRVLFFEVFPLGGGPKLLFSGKIGTMVVKNDKSGVFSSKNAPLPSHVEIILGVDAMGVQGPGVIVRSSGSPGVDSAVLSWSGQVPWAKRLPPGSYRVVVGP